MDTGVSLEPSDDEDYSEERRSPAPQASPQVSSASTPGRATCPATAAPPLRLGLSFSGGSVGGGGHDWREGRFSDWTVIVGEKSYHLHAFLLARASLFFASHMDVSARAGPNENGTFTRSSNLTKVLPQSCHAAFESALDFIYSENQAAFEAPASKALLLLKIADILGIAALFDAMGKRIDSAFSDTAPLLLEQYCRFHIPHTDDGPALRQIRDGAVELIVRKFQPFLANPEMHTAMLRLPADVLADILEADDLLVAGEDTVFDFVAARAEAVLSDRPRTGSGDDSDAGSHGEGPSSCAEADGSPHKAACSDGDLEELWRRVRWAHLSANKFAEALSLGRRLLRPEVTLEALTSRVARSDLGGVEALSSLSPPPALAPPRRPILPPGVPPPTSTEIDFCFHYSHIDQFNCGDALRSQPKRVGDIVLRVLVFPAGTDTGVARGSLSVFLEAVPQPQWPRDWEFANVRYAIACIRWPTGSGETWAAKRKSDLWTFKANRLDRGWHDFLAPGEIHKYLGPDGFVCIRGSLEPECLGRTFLLNCQVGSGTYAAGEAAGSSGSRRSWAPRATPSGVGIPPPPPPAAAAD